jgi:hypothetical protein
MEGIHPFYDENSLKNIINHICEDPLPPMKSKFGPFLKHTVTQMLEKVLKLI